MGLVVSVVVTNIELSVVRDVRLDELAHLGASERLAEHLIPGPAVAGSHPGQVPLPPPPDLHHDPVRAHRLRRLLPERRVQPHAPAARLLLLGEQRRLARPGPRHGRRREGQERGLPDGERRRAGRLGVAELEVERRAGEAEGEARGPHDDGAARGGVGRVGGEEGLAIAGSRDRGHGLAVCGAEVGRAEGGAVVAGGRSRTAVCWFLLFLGTLLGVVPGVAAARGEWREGKGPVLRVAAVGEGRRRGGEEVRAAGAGGSRPLRRRWRHGGNRWRGMK